MTDKSIFNLFATRRQAIIGAAQVTLAVSASGILAGCVTIDKHRLTLAEVLIDDGTGAVPYLDVVGDLPEVGWMDKGLPLGNIKVASLPAVLEWMAPYDFSGNGTIDKAEMTQAWLVKIAVLKTGKTYAPDSLKSHPKTASLTGITLALPEEKAMRAMLNEAADKTTQAAIKEMVALINDALEKEGGGGDNGGGSGGSSEGGGNI